MKKKFFQYTVLFSLVSFCFWSSFASAERMSSSNYRIERDSINIGGLLSSSSNYLLEDTAGEVGTGTSSSATYQLKAGYQQMEVVIISITSPADVGLSPSIPNTGGEANGSATWRVTTNNDTGYTLSIQASTNPTLTASSGSFDNYTPFGLVPDYVWGAAGGAKEFGFTPEGTDISSNYKDNGSACGVGSGDTVATCWDSITTNAKTIVSRATANSPVGGINTIVRFRAEATSGSGLVEGAYSAVITVTAVTQ